MNHQLKQIQRPNRKQHQKQKQKQTQNTTLKQLIMMILSWKEQNLGLIKDQLGKRNFKNTHKYGWK